MVTVHFPGIGRKKFPDSKFGILHRNSENGLGINADVALMKLCYVDFKADTDVKLLADQYSTMLERLGLDSSPITIFVTGSHAINNSSNPA